MRIIGRLMAAAITVSIAVPAAVPAAGAAPRNGSAPTTPATAAAALDPLGALDPLAARPTRTSALTGAGTGYVPLTPARLLETRPGLTTTDGQAQGTGPIPAGTTLELQITGRAGIPTDATAVVLNITVTEPQTNGHITVLPCGQPTPTASNLNYTTGTTIPNAVITKIGTNGKVCLHTSGTTHLITDTNGYFPADGAPAVGSLGPTASATLTVPAGGGRLYAGTAFADVPAELAGTAVQIDTYQPPADVDKPTGTPVRVTIANTGLGTITVGLPVNETHAGNIPDHELAVAVVDPATNRWVLSPTAPRIERTPSGRIGIATLTTTASNARTENARTSRTETSRTEAFPGSQVMASIVSVPARWINDNMFNGYWTRYSADQMPICGTAPSRPAVLPSDRFGRGDTLLVCTEDLGTKIRIKVKNNRSIAFRITREGPVTFGGQWNGQGIVNTAVVSASKGTILLPGAEAWYEIAPNDTGTLRVERDVTMSVLNTVLQELADRAFPELFGDSTAVRSLLSCAFEGYVLDNVFDQITLPALPSLSGALATAEKAIGCIAGDIDDIVADFIDRKGLVNDPVTGRFVTGNQLWQRAETWAGDFAKGIDKAKIAAIVTAGLTDSWESGSGFNNIQVGNVGLRITTTAIPAATVGTNYSFALGSAGGTGAVTWAHSGPVPAGLTITSQLIKGFPTAATGPGGVNLMFTVTDQGGGIHIKNFTFVVNPGQLDPALNPTLMRGKVVRTDTGAASFYVDLRGVRHAIPDGGTYECIAAQRGVYATIVPRTWFENTLPAAEAAQCVRANPGDIIRHPVNLDSYVVQPNFTKRWIPNGTSYNCEAARNRTVVDAPRYYITDLTSGTDLTTAQSCTFLARNPANGQVWQIDDTGRRQLVPDGWSLGCWQARGYPYVDSVAATKINTIQDKGGIATCALQSHFLSRVIVVSEPNGTTSSYAVTNDARLYWIKTTQGYNCIRNRLGYGEITGMTRATFDRGVNDGIVTYKGHAHCLDSAQGVVSNIGAWGINLFRSADGTPWVLHANGTTQYIPDWEEGYACVRNHLAVNGLLHSEQTGVPRWQIDGADRGGDWNCWNPAYADNKIVRNYLDGTSFYVAYGKRWYINSQQVFNCLGGMANSYNVPNYNDVNGSYPEYGAGAIATCAGGRFAQDRLYDCGANGSFVVDWWGWRHRIGTTQGYFSWKDHFNRLYGADGLRSACDNDFWSIRLASGTW